jgi:hypothetical protein
VIEIAVVMAGSNAANFSNVAAVVEMAATINAAASLERKDSDLKIYIAKG